MSAVGQVTDDTEMALALALSLAESGGAFDERRAVAHYIAWANSGCWFLGNNTRKLRAAMPGPSRRKAASKRRPSRMGA